MKDFNIFILIFSVISLFLALFSFYVSIKTKKKYERLAIKLGSGENIADILKNYIKTVEELDKKDDQIIEYCNKINEEDDTLRLNFTIYTLYNTTKHNLSFALAMLDKENNGVIINSIYGSDYSNVYSKLIINGESKEKLSSEEQEALNIAKSK